MTIELTPEMETIISDRLSSGRYSSAQAVVEEALHVLGSRSANPQTTGMSAPIALYTPPSQEEREERARAMDELFARIDAEGPFEDFKIERHTAPLDRREPWLT